LALSATSYSTTVDGKSYLGSVQESEGTYVAYVPSPPPGASASGSSAEAAENNLNILLSTLA
jgi:predicted RNase H-like HicB family nuclease